METPDFFRSRIDAMINLNDPLAVLARRLPWGVIETAVAAKFARQDRVGQSIEGTDLFGPTAVVLGGGVSTGGRPKLPIRLMASLIYLKNCFNLSDEELCSRWSENIVWQFFSGMDYYEHRLPCDATQIGRFRRALGEDGLEQLLKATIDTAVAIKAVKPTELERVIVDTTVQEKAIAHPVDSRLMEIARHKVISAAKRAGISLKQTFAKEGKELRRKAGGYAEPGHKLSSGQLVPGEGLGLRPNAACKVTPNNSVVSSAPSSASARSWASSCAKCSASRPRLALPAPAPRL